MSDVHTATGRRRTSVASVRLKAGSGKIEVNKREFNDYFPTTTLQTAVLRPLELAGRKQHVDITLKTSGGGVAGQAGVGLVGGVDKESEALNGPVSCR